MKLLTDQQKNKRQLRHNLLAEFNKRSFATAKSTARPSYLVGVLYDISR